MVNLPELNEDSMVENLRVRFDAGLPYTICGQICVSVNPFCWLPLYEDQAVSRYNASSDPFTSEPPHVYSVVHAALRRLTHGEGTTADALPSQSILVSLLCPPTLPTVTHACPVALPTVIGRIGLRRVRRRED